jgi:DNA-binding NarL/FixJ family response regulator
MSPSVYVVEPQTIFIPELARIVAVAGGHVARFADALDVEEIASLATEYAIVDLDYSEVGVLDGLAFFRTIAPKTRVVVLTAETDFAALEQFRAAGCVAVVPKSMSADEVRDVLREMFARDATAVRGLQVIKGEAVDGAGRSDERIGVPRKRRHSRPA